MDTYRGKMNSQGWEYPVAGEKADPIDQDSVLTLRGGHSNTLNWLIPEG